MVNSRFSGNEVGIFFGAVTKSLKTFVGNSKRKVRDQITKRGIAKNHLVLFLCWPNGNNKIKKNVIGRPGFKLTKKHHVVLETACVDFLTNLTKQE